MVSKTVIYISVNEKAEGLLLKKCLFLSLMFKTNNNNESKEFSDGVNHVDFRLQSASAIIF